MSTETRDLRTESHKRQDAIRAEQDKQPLPSFDRFYDKNRRRSRIGWASDTYKGRERVWRGGPTGDVERIA